MEVEGKASGSLPAPGPIGRSVRVFLGAALLYFFASIIREVSANPRAFLGALAGSGIPSGDWWVVALGCLLALPFLVNNGFGGKWGEWVRAGYLALIAAATSWDRMAHGGLWAAPLAWLVLLLTLYVFAHAGVSCLVAAIAATPG